MLFFFANRLSPSNFGLFLICWHAPIYCGRQVMPSNELGKFEGVHPKILQSKCKKIFDQNRGSSPHPCFFFFLVVVVVVVVVCLFVCFSPVTKKKL